MDRSIWSNLPISGQVDRMSAAKTVDLVLILCRVKPIVITFYSPSCFGQERAKGPLGLQVKSTAHVGGFTLSLLMLNVKQESCEYQFL